MLVVVVVVIIIIILLLLLLLLYYHHHYYYYYYYYIIIIIMHLLGYFTRRVGSMVNTRMESRLDIVDKMLQKLIQDKDRQENQSHERFQRLEDMIRDLTAVVESMSCSATKGETASVMNVGHGSHWEEETSHHLSSSKWRKLDIPVFAGEEAYGWTNRLERYFRLKEVSEEERMQAVRVALEGRALNWFQWWETCNPNPTWEAFKVAIVRRFQPTMLQNPFELLIGLRQSGLVEEYIEQFEQYAGFLKGIPQDYLVGIFLNGLKEEIKAEVKLYEPNNLLELMMKAQMVEEKVRIISKGGPSHVLRNNNVTKPISMTRSYSKDEGSSLGFTNSNSGRGESSASAGTFRSVNQSNRAPFRKLSQEEIQDKVKKGLCFRCDEKFGPNHICRNKQLHMLLMSEEELSGLDTLQPPLWSTGGFEVVADGVATDPTNVEAMTNWPVPKNAKALRGFLGLIGYYRRFVKGFGQIAKPLTQLLTKEGFCWTHEAQQAFGALKSAVSKLPILAVPDFSKSFTLETNASSKGLGAVLLQEGRPLAFWSQTLSDRGQQKSVYERELMTIVQAVQKWKHYLMGSHFVIITDQKSLKFLTDQRLLTEQQFKWAFKLIGYDFEIRFRPGKENSVADALSRRQYFMAMSLFQTDEWETWETEVQHDPKLVFQELLLNPKAHEGYELKKGRLFYHGTLVLPRTFSRIPSIIKELHESPIGGHSGYFRTFKRVAGVLYWEGMKRDIKEFVMQCAVCQCNKTETLAPAVLLQPLPIPTQVWSDISMDFIGGLPKVQGKDTILVVVDRLTKYAHFLALAHPFTAVQVADLFIKEVVKLHGFPSTIVSDCEKLFLSTFWRELFRQAGSKLKFSTTYHPQSDGQT
ncbi:hypothetical protein V8G54_012022 [Vigna mungo]|uniref:Integrase catalytic domain-containing protein n=1 Tax=Vigna mungo TaxID=3915 RepID=A0AAQ3NQL9_VIGMU